MNSTVNVFKFIIFAFLALFCLLAYPYLNPENINIYIKKYKLLAPLLFIGLCAIRPMLFFIPSMGLTIVAGVLFGAFYGTIYVVIGGAISTVVGFYFARWLGRGMIELLMKKNSWIEHMDRWSIQYGKNIIFSMRLFNLPWDLVSYWAGLSGMKFKDFYLASLVLLVPVSFLFTYFGSKVFEPKSAGFVISLGIILIMGAVPHIRKKWEVKANDREYRSN